MKRIAIILGLTTAALAQQSHSRPAFREGMSKAQVHAAFGPPAGHFNGHFMDEVYIRRTAHNTYQCLVFYIDDPSQSQLHPTERVNDVECRLDKMVAVENLPALLADLPEAARLCAHEDGCCIHEDGFSYPYTVQPIHPSADQTSLVGEDKTVFVQSLGFELDSRDSAVRRIATFHVMRDQYRQGSVSDAWRPRTVITKDNK